MVTNVYSNIFLPNLKTYNINPNKKTFKGSINHADQNDPNKRKKDLQDSESSASKRCLNKFLTSENPDINISDILQDFKDTMTNLGIPKSVGKEIMAELKNAHVHGSSDNPSISEIQNSLYKSAKLVDKYVSDTIGQPSSFVKQWVDALLLQKINYTAYDPLPKEVVEKEVSAIVLSENKTTNTSTTRSSLANTNSSLSEDKISLQDDTPSYEIKNSIEINNPKDIIDNPATNTVKTTESTKAKTATIKIDTTQDIHKDSVIGQIASEEIKKIYREARSQAAESNYGEAEKRYKQVITLAEEIQDKKLLVRSYKDLAKIYDQKHDLNTSLKYYHQAIKVASELKNPKALAKLHFDVGSIYDDMNLNTQALKHYHASLAFDGEIDNQEGQALTLNNMANIYTSDNKIDRAVECYELAYILADQTQDNEAQAHILSNIGTIYKTKNDNTNALEYYRRSLKIDQDNNNLVGYTKTLLNIGDIYDSLDYKDRAEKYYSKALSNARSLNDPYLMSRVFERINT